MNEPQIELDDALRQVHAAWDDARTERTLPGARSKLRARQRRVWAASGALATALVVVGLGIAGRGPLPGLGGLGGDPNARSGAASSAERAIEFEDGSRALLLDPDAQVVVAAVSPSAIDVSLPRGSARFDVARRPERTFRVACGAVDVEVLGTSFELTRDGERTRVRVLHGRVAVRWPGGRTELGAGAADWFPRAAASPSPTAAPAPAPNAADDPRAVQEPSAADGESAPARRARADGWRQHAEQGDFNRAYALLQDSGGGGRARVADDVEELLLAADAARLSGHPAEAVPFLQKVVDAHTDDPRAPLAAFTLGSVLMNQLGRPREAESAYGRARELSPQSSLSQDALARQVEAAHRAGDPSRARALSLEYLERYPQGRRVQAVRRFGGLP